MSEKNKQPNFWSKLKNTKVNRAAIVTAFVLVLALAVIISITVATNRRKKDPLPEDTTKKVTTTTTQGNQNTTTGQNQTTTGKKDTIVNDNLPDFSLPVSGILGKGHDATMQVYSKTLKEYNVHIGIDIMTEANAPVYAAADGTISKVWEDPLMGYCIGIKHTGNAYTFYKNLAEELPAGISEGVKVRAGQLIANVGDSAMIEIADEPHLHFEMTIADLSVNPLDYFDENALATLKVDSSHGE